MGLKTAFHDVINDIIQDVLSHASAHTYTPHITCLCIVTKHKDEEQE